MDLVTIPITTTAGGAFTADTPMLQGVLRQYRYVPHASTPLDTGADLDIAGKVTGIVYANQDNIGTTAFTKAPRGPTHDETGAASLFAAAGEPVEDTIGIAEQLTITIAQGGNAKSGTLYLWID